MKWWSAQLADSQLQRIPEMAIDGASNDDTNCMVMDAFGVRQGEEAKFDGRTSEGIKGLHSEGNKTHFHEIEKNWPNSILANEYIRINLNST